MAPGVNVLVSEKGRVKSEDTSVEIVFSFHLLTVLKIKLKVQQVPFLLSHPLESYL